MNAPIILGAGMTGLAAGVASGLEVYEAEQIPGGICSSYYVRPGDKERLAAVPLDGEAYRFEIGGGHWIFGGDPIVLHFIRSLAPIRSYQRQSSVFFPPNNLFVPYPLQNHLRFLDPHLASKALQEMAQAASTGHSIKTMADWLQASFGPTLCELFFEPFHDLYTAGLYREIAPQDAYKSPVNLSLAVQGAFTDASPVGYNVTYIYPEEGLNVLAQRMAEKSQVRYGKRITLLDTQEKTVCFADGTDIPYTTLLSTLPLNRVLELTGFAVFQKPLPYTSVLVINVGAVRGPRCPEEHWVYIPSAKGRFHRVGFYSNVDPLFLPSTSRDIRDRVSIYVERAFPGGQKPSPAEIDEGCRTAVEELQEWQWIGWAEVVDPTWIDVAYTWSWPDGRGLHEAYRLLEEAGIYQIGRYARWSFQGIADSIRDGLMAGAAWQVK